MKKVRRRVTGQLEHGPRGPVIVTEAGDRWVIDYEDIEPELIGRLVIAEGAVIGLDRLNVDWVGEEHDEA